MSATTLLPGLFPRLARWAIAALSAGSAILFMAGSATAQYMGTPGTPSGQIAATGHVHLQRSPTHLRMYLQVTAKGKTLEEALAALKERREAVSASLEKLGTEKGALAFTTPGIDEAAVMQQRQMEAMIAQRMSAGSRGAAAKAAKPAKPPVSVATMLTAQWPLSGDSTEKLLLAAEALHEKIKAADLAGPKEAPKLSAEEQEVAEETAAAMARSRGGEPDPSAGNEPRFIFVSKLSAQDRQTAMSDAFAKAKAQAAELAQAAGVGLGHLVSLNGEMGGGMGGYNSYSRYGYGRGGDDEFLQQLAQQMPGQSDQHGEAMATQPNGIAFDFAVAATFAIEDSKK